MSLVPDWLYALGFRRILHIDLETFAARKLGKQDSVGVYKYVECNQFTIQLCAVRWDDYAVEQWDYMAGEDMDDETYDALLDPKVLKVAHNAYFELVALSEFYGIELDPAQWYCTMIGAALLGLPFALGDIADVLGLDNKKDKRGDALIELFAKPCKPTKKNGGRSQNLPEHMPEDWQAYKEYNVQDVYTECDIFEYLMRMPQQPAVEREYWVLDYWINRRGFMIDLWYARQALKLNDVAVERAHLDIKALTGVANPNSMQQIKAWLKSRTGRTFGSLDAEAVENLLAEDYLPNEVYDYLELRQISGKTSVSKYKRMLDWSARDRRNHGAIQYYGATRTGRFAGRGSQPHNMARTLEPDDLNEAFGYSDIELLRDYIRSGKLPKGIRDVSNLIKVMVRCAVVAPKGKLLIPRDFNAIEARVLAWFAGEEWRLEFFEDGTRDLYKESYSRTFNRAYDDVDKEERQIGKVNELSLGYGGGKGAIAKMDKKKKIEPSKREPIKKAWRAANPMIVKSWKRVEEAAKDCIRDRRTVTLRMPYCTLTFKYYKGYMLLYLPSGRFLSYYGARLDSEGGIVYMGARGEGGGWVKNYTYGGSLVENIVQAIARDILCDAMLRVDAAGIDIVMHVHDEIVAESWEDEADEVLEEMGEIMAVMPHWANGLPMKSAGFTSRFYKKD